MDDNVSSAEATALLLKTVGLDVRVVFDGYAALKEAEQFHPRMLVIDLATPKLSGYEVCRRIRGAGWGSGMTLVAVSGRGQEHDAERSRAAGFDAHLVKPVDADALLSLVSHHSS